MRIPREQKIKKLKKWIATYWPFKKGLMVAPWLTEPEKGDRVTGYSYCMVCKSLKQYKNILNPITKKINKKIKQSMFGHWLSIFASSVVLW